MRLMRTIAQSRKGRDHWLSTQDNVFAVKAIMDFSRRYEATPPDLSIQAFLDSESLGKARFSKIADPPVELERPMQPADPGRQAPLRIVREGQGRLYYGIQLTYSPVAMKTDPVNAGIEVQREYSVEREGAWVLLQSPMEIKTGELVRVDVYVVLPAERHFVVVRDPVPGGLEPVNQDLATASTVNAEKGRIQHPPGSLWHTFNDWLDDRGSRWSFYHTELRFDAVRFYSEMLPAGRYHLAYVAQAIAPGEFSAGPTLAEEMYNPDVYGKGAPVEMRVQASE
jgi:uncharacterized protein YfaS (alpha-2-macroglobulin family)